MDNTTMKHTSHVLDIIRAALPYVPSRTRNSMEVAIKTGELAESFSSVGQVAELEACDLENESVDMEGLLLSMQSVAIGPERDMLSTIFNFYKTRSMYQAYQAFRQNNPTPELSAASIGNNAPNGMNSQLFQFLMSQLSPEQKSTFENISALMRANNASEQKPNPQKNQGGFPNFPNGVFPNFNLSNHNGGNNQGKK